VGGKRLELLRDVVPRARSIGLLVNPHGAAAGPQTREMQQFAKAAGVHLHIVNVSRDREFDTAFATLAELQVGALLVTVDRFLDAQPSQLVALASRYRMPGIYSRREFVEAGGLMSYGSRIADAYRMAGIYAGRILKGEKPSELPVILPTKFEWVINLKTATALGLDIPPGLLAGADEVLE
jgi:putative ABC transport system substrate-binding protein